MISVMPKSWRLRCLSCTSLRLDMVSVLHFAAQKRTFQEVAHILLRSWFSESATALPLDLMKAMKVTSSAYKIEELERLWVMSSN